MRTPIRHRQLRGLVLHHRRHQAEHPRRLVNRTARWGEPPVNSICRWCYELTANIKIRWHPYCLNAYRDSPIDVKQLYRAPRQVSEWPSRLLEQHSV